MADLHSEAYPMVGGDGEYSYAKNSAHQKAAVEGTKDVLIATISENLDLYINGSSSTSFHIADLGCSIGPATFYAVETIIEAVKIKYQSQGHSDKIPEFFVFFNDHVGNDFNALIANLPPERQYFAAAVPGSFHGRLFPKARLDFTYSSNAMHWLSKLPKDFSHANSPAYNKGRISYSSAPVEVCDAFSAQFAKDFESSINARAQETVPGGLVALLFPGRLDRVTPSETYFGSFSILESCLQDMTKEGIVSEEAMDSFNLPMYFSSPEELKKIIQGNNCFDIVKLETILHAKSQPIMSKQHVRAGLGGILTTYFGIETLDELFERYEKKIEGLSYYDADESHMINILIVLKRKN